MYSKREGNKAGIYKSLSAPDYAMLLCHQQIAAQTHCLVFR